MCLRESLLEANWFNKQFLCRWRRYLLILPDELWKPYPVIPVIEQLQPRNASLPQKALILNEWMNALLVKEEVIKFRF